MQLRSCHSYCNSAGFPQRLNHFCYHGKPRVTYCFKIKLRFFVFQKKHYSSFSEVVILSPRLRFEFEIRCQKSFQHLPLQQPICFNVALCLAMYCLFAITKKGVWWPSMAVRAVETSRFQRKLKRFRKTWRCGNPPLPSCSTSGQTAGTQAFWLCMLSWDIPQKIKKNNSWLL